MTTFLKCPNCANEDSKQFESTSTVTVSMILNESGGWVLNPDSPNWDESYRELNAEAVESWDSNDEVICLACDHEAPEFEFRVTE